MRQHGRHAARIAALAMMVDYSKLEERIIAHYAKQKAVIIIETRDIDDRKLQEILGYMEIYGKVEVKTWSEMTTTRGQVDMVIDDMLLDVKSYGGGMIQTSYEDLTALAGLCDVTATGRFKVDPVPWLQIYDEVRMRPPGISDKDLADLIRAKDQVMEPKVCREETYPSRNRGRASKGDRHKNKRYRWS